MLLLRSTRLIQAQRITTRPIDIQEQVRDLPLRTGNLVLAKAPVVIPAFLEGLT